jgi:hypothetical protein
MFDSLRFDCSSLIVSKQFSLHIYRAFFGDSSMRLMEYLSNFSSLKITFGKVQMEAHESGDGRLQVMSYKYYTASHM